MDYSGMTINERLSLSGQMKEFDSAKRNKDREKLIAILENVKVDKSSINDILRSLEI